jgi:hypothetical protein
MNNPNQAPKNIIIEGINSQIADFSSKIPSHIRKLMNPLKEVREDSAKVSKILRSFSHFTQGDETLNEIFLHFGWDSRTKLFAKTVNYNEFLSKIQCEYGITFPEQDDDDKKVQRRKESQDDLLFNPSFAQHFQKTEMNPAKNVISNSYESNFSNNFIDCFLTNSAKALYSNNRPVQFI